MRTMQILSVTQLNRYVKNKLEEDPLLSVIYVKGEISNFTHHRMSGHMYFTLKDSSSAVKCVMFSSYASRLKFVPENGLSVVVGASVSLYERDGAYQLYVNDMIPEGAGALQLAFEQLKQKLEKEGLFDQYSKKQLPKYPEKIGVIMSEHSAAFQDVCNIISRRYPVAKILLAHSSVQGENAEKELIDALNKIDGKCDVIIIGRGGGSYEDLWTFNSEKLAYALHRVKTPVVSAVGHETDFTICDFVCDMRAPTPSAAAELVTPDIKELLAFTGSAPLYFKSLLSKKTDNLKNSLDGYSSRLVSAVKGCIDSEALKIMYLEKNMTEQLKRQIENKNVLLKEKIYKLDANNPLKKLADGYVKIEKNGNAVTCADDVAPDDIVDIQLSDAVIKAKITEIIKRGELLNAEKETEF